jgi:hypothetical protein
MRAVLAIAALALAGCANVVLHNDDARRATVLAPYTRAMPPFGQIRIPEGTTLYPATVNGEPGWCSTTALQFVPGEGRPMCLFDPAGSNRDEGWFKLGYIGNTTGNLRYEVDVPYRVTRAANLPPRP